MVVANLHMICGNCGRDDMFDLNVNPTKEDVDKDSNPLVYIGCGNCCTIHNLNDNIRKEGKDA